MKSFLHSGSRQPSAWFKWATRTPRQRCRRIDFTPLKFSISYSKRNRVTPSHLLVKSHDNCRVQDNQAEFQSAKVDVWLDTPITMIAHCPGHPHELPGLHSVVAFSQIEQFSRSQKLLPRSRKTSRSSQCKVRLTLCYQRVTFKTFEGFLHGTCWWNRSFFCVSILSAVQVFFPTSWRSMWLMETEPLFVWRRLRRRPNPSQG